MVKKRQVIFQLITVQKRVQKKIKTHFFKNHVILVLQRPNC